MAVGDILVRADAVYQSAASYLNAIIIALAILFVGFIIARITGAALNKLFAILEFDDWCTGLFGRRRKYARATRTTIVRTLYLITMYLALRSLRLAGVAITVIAAILVAIILVSLAILAIELIPNIAARSRLRARHIGVGDEVEIDHSSGRISGKIVGMSLFEVQVRRPSGDIVFFPNATLTGVRIAKRRSKK
jgi:small-conductance mechanosensitive channel